MIPACVQTDAQLLAAQTDPRPGHPTLQGHEGEGQHPLPPTTTGITQLQFKCIACCGQKNQAEREGLNVYYIMRMNKEFIY